MRDHRIVDEKSLNKKYQREISSVKLYLDQLKKGILVGVSHEEIMSLRQQLEEGQVKMQSRLEEEEEAKAALMSRIQRLTKLILISSKYPIPGILSDVSSHHRSHYASKDSKLDVLCNGYLLLDCENQKDSSSSAFSIPLDVNDFKHRRSSSKWNDDISQAGNVLTETTQAGELIIGSSSALKLPIDGMTMSDQMDLLNEQVKMLAGEIASSTSMLKCLIEQSVNDLESSRTQIQNLEREIQEMKKHWRNAFFLRAERRGLGDGKTSFVFHKFTLRKSLKPVQNANPQIRIPNRNHCINRTDGKYEEFGSNSQNPDVFLAQQISKFIQTRPRWEQTLLSDIPGVNFMDPNVYNEVLK
ncbi:kinesin-like protein KIN-7D [Forsythia ovata]|uniref:Kinesin-like protein KIN-7D n=1 Tax=Forsythia ovata TaxID=205694 RepID=A0ABD1U5K2_9LAMI